MTTRPLRERLEGFDHVKPTPVKRNGASYHATYKFVHRSIRMCILVYSRLQKQDQTARLVRDAIDFMLRRYQNYCIKENIGAHYRERGLAKGQKVEFEHVIPASVARDLLLFKRMTIDEALEIPTCLLSADNHKQLNSTGLASSTPDVYNFWQRYQSLNIEIETYNGQLIDTKSWTLDDHYKFFSASRSKI